jgi:DNA polymerase-3 subunit epsilon
MIHAPARGVPSFMSYPPLAFVDLETTGATATADRITEIGIIEVDENGMREWSTLVNPGTPISSFIESLTGISNAMVADAPAFEDVAEEVLERLDGRLFIAHNARFDYGFLKNEFKRSGHDFRATVLCTVKLSRKLFPQHARHNLDSLVARHGLVVSARHRALGDARLIHQFWSQLRDDIEPDLLAATVRQLTARPSLPPNLDPAAVDELPDGTGVYLFYGENNLPLYVGKSKELKKRILSHFAADHAAAKEMSLAQQVRRIECIETGGEIGALLKEAALIKSLQPIHNRTLRRNDDLCFWQLVEARPGEWRPRLLPAGELGTRLQEHLYGPFKTTREANRTLTELAKEHRLCHALLRPPVAAVQGGLCRQGAGVLPQRTPDGRPGQTAAGAVAVSGAGLDTRGRGGAPDRPVAAHRYGAVRSGPARAVRQFFARLRSGQLSDPAESCRAHGPAGVCLGSLNLLVRSAAAGISAPGSAADCAGARVFP